MISRRRALLHDFEKAKTAVEHAKPQKMDAVSPCYVLNMSAIRTMWSFFTLNIKKDGMHCGTVHRGIVVAVRVTVYGYAMQKVNIDYSLSPRTNLSSLQERKRTCRMPPFLS